MSKSKKSKSKPAGVRRDAQGRAHLVIQRDEYGTPVGLALSARCSTTSGRTTSRSPTASTAHAMLG